MIPPCRLSVSNCARRVRPKNWASTRLWTSPKSAAIHIRALEEGNYSVFSAPVYIRGFVRTYATLLKLDTAQILEQLGRELADSGQVDPMLTPPAQSILDVAMFQLSKFSHRMAWPAVGHGGVGLVIVGGYLLWMHYQQRGPDRRFGRRPLSSPHQCGGNIAAAAMMGAENPACIWGLGLVN